MFPINIIYNITNNSLRLNKFEEGGAQNLMETNFYVPKGFGKAVFAFLRANNQYDIIKLTMTSSNGNYNIYNVASTNINMMQQKGNDFEISLIICDAESIIKSKSEKIKLDLTDFNYATQVGALQAVSAKMAEMYDKITQMTELNINLYKDIQEVNNK